MPRKMKVRLLLLFFVGSIPALFVANGIWPSWRTPRTFSHAEARERDSGASFTVMALNCAKCDFYTGGLTFASRQQVTAKLDAIVELINAEQPCVVMLSEVVHECGIVPVDQVRYIAERAGFPHWATSDNYSFGLPFFRIRSGNALLSRVPMRAIATQQLSSEGSFWNPTNNRRALWVELFLDGKWILTGSVRNDSFDAQNNEKQVAELLRFIGTRQSLLGGDFNAELDSPSMQLLLGASFGKPAIGLPTFPAKSPWRCIDHIIGPSGWGRTRDRAISTIVSDHLAIIVTFDVL